MNGGQWNQRRILIGICGGIAAYKSAELVRLCRRQGADVQVVLTEAATRFVTPMTLQALAGRPVRISLWDEGAEAAMGHIELARWAERLIIAPASADFLAKLNAGLADDLLSTICLATEAPLAVAPAMNRIMWSHPATQANIRNLRERGVTIWGPGTGEQACGETGVGRMLEPAEILILLEQSFQPGRLQGVRVMVTAGPTREPIDPVRFVSNRSSGRMGYAVADAAARAGAQVTLVSGPVALEPPPMVTVIHVESACQMQAAVMAKIAEQDIFIGTAAVADYTTIERSDHKIKKTADRLRLDLVPTPDILAGVTALPKPPFTVGFAAETQALEHYAQAKLAAKNLDMIAANEVGQGRGFEVEENALWVFWPEGRRHFPLAPKSTLAKQLIALIAERYETKNRTEDSG